MENIKSAYEQGLEDSLELLNEKYNLTQRLEENFEHCFDEIKNILFEYRNEILKLPMIENTYEEFIKNVNNGIYDSYQKSMDEYTKWVIESEEEERLSFILKLKDVLNGNKPYLLISEEDDDWSIQTPWKCRWYLITKNHILTFLKDLSKSIDDLKETDFDYLRDTYREEISVNQLPLGITF